MSSPLPSSVALSFIVTRAGKAAFLNAEASGLKLQLTHIALGNAPHAPSYAATALNGEQLRSPIAEGSLSNSGLQLDLGAEFAPSAGFYVYEVGVFAGPTLVFLWSTAVAADYLMFKNADVRTGIGFALAVDGVPPDLIQIVDAGFSMGVLFDPYRQALAALFNDSMQRHLREITAGLAALQPSAPASAIVLPPRI